MFVNILRVAPSNFAFWIVNHSIIHQICQLVFASFLYSRTILIFFPKRIVLVILDKVKLEGFLIFKAMSGCNIGLS